MWLWPSASVKLIETGVKVKTDMNLIMQICKKVPLGLASVTITSVSGAFLHLPNTKVCQFSPHAYMLKPQ